MNETLRYPYNLPWRLIAICVVGYGVLSGGAVYLAGDADPLTRYAMFLLSVVFAMLGLGLTARRYWFPRVLELTDEAIQYPHGFFRTKIARIPYADIIRLGEVRDGASDTLWLTTADHSWAIEDLRLPSNRAYREVRAHICSRASITLPEHKLQGARTQKTWVEAPEPLLLWHEPVEWPRYRAHLYRSMPLLPRIASECGFFALCAAIPITPWLLLRAFGIPTASVREYLALSGAVALLFTLVHWLLKLFPVGPSRISFRLRGITSDNGKQWFYWHYRELSGWAVTERPFEGRVLHFLLVNGRSGMGVFALPDKQTCDQAVQLLRDQQIPEDSGLRPML